MLVPSIIFYFDPFCGKHYVFLKHWLDVRVQSKDCERRKPKQDCIHYSYGRVYTRKRLQSQVALAPGAFQNLMKSTSGGFSHKAAMLQLNYVFLVGKTFEGWRNSTKLLKHLFVGLKERGLKETSGLILIFFRTDTSFKACIQREWISTKS